MRVTFECVSDDSGKYDGKRGAVKYQQLALLDKSLPADSRMVQTVDYRMSDEEKEVYAGKCLDKKVTLDVKDIAIFNSRIQIKSGRIVEVEGVKIAKPA